MFEGLCGHGFVCHFLAKAATCSRAVACAKAAGGGGFPNKLVIGLNLLEWMDDFHVVPNAPVEQQVPRSDAAPGPQGWLDFRSRKGRAFPWSPIPNEARKRHLECGGSTPLWIRQGYPTEHSSTFTIPLLKISNFHCASKQSGGVRGGGLECCVVLGFADRIQSGVEPPHSRVGLAYLGGFGVC
jgi:hypothetical protein